MYEDVETGMGRDVSGTEFVPAAKRGVDGVEGDAVVRVVLDANPKHVNRTC